MSEPEVELPEKLEVQVAANIVVKSVRNIVRKAMTVEAIFKLCSLLCYCNM